jgi:hypothetical protein
MEEKGMGRVTSRAKPSKLFGVDVHTFACLVPLSLGRVGRINRSSRPMQAVSGERMEKCVGTSSLQPFVHKYAL